MMLKKKILKDELQIIKKPWFISEVKIDERQHLVNVYIRYNNNISFRCPVCKCISSGYDHKVKKWRHLDCSLGQIEFIVKVPRINCSAHKIKMIDIPWAEKRSSYTYGFEAFIYNCLKDSSINSIAKRVGLSWHVISVIKLRFEKRMISNLIIAT